MVLQVKGLSKSFDNKIVLKDVNFQLETGKILAIIGPSGAGKTTFLRCINGLEKSDKGTIKIDGSYLCRQQDNRVTYASPEEMRAIRRKIGLVFQNYNLFPHMSVIENIMEAPVNAFNIAKDKARNNAVELLNIMGLADKVDSYPFELSGGQQQRVAIARACALNPKIMCLDEPTSALDPELREGIASIIKDLAQNNNMGVLIITHDMAFAKRVSDKIIFMENGLIIKEDSKENFFNNSEDERIKRFIT